MERFVIGCTGWRVKERYLFREPMAGSAIMGPPAQLEILDGIRITSDAELHPYYL